MIPDIQTNDNKRWPSFLAVATVKITDNFPLPPPPPQLTQMVLMYKDPKGETLFDSMTPRTEITTDRKLSRGSTVNSPTDSSSKNGFNMYGKRWLNRRVTTCGVLSDEQGKKEEESKSKLRKVSSYDTTVCKVIIYDTIYISVVISFTVRSHDLVL